MSGIDIDKVKKEIERKKTERGISGMKNPKDGFLNKLKESLERGTPNESINKIKVVSNKAAEKASMKTGVSEKKPYSHIDPNVEHHYNEPQQRRPIIDEGYNPREEQMYQEFQSSNRTLADSLSQYVGGQQSQYSGGQPQHPGQINEQLMVRRIDERIDQYLSKNVGDIFNESIKSVILEQFAKERIAEVLEENEDLIRKTVISVIKEIKTRNAQNKK